MMMHGLRVVTAAATLWAAALVWPAVVGAAQQIRFYECGDVPAYATGILETDVVCGGFHCAGDAGKSCDPDDDASCGPSSECVPGIFTLGVGSRLMLNGHTINMELGANAVECGPETQQGTCAIFGPGSIQGNGDYPTILSYARRLVLRDLSIGGSSYDAVLANGWVVARRLVVRHDGGNRITGFKGIRIADSIWRGRSGMLGGPIIAHHLRIGPGGYLSASKLLGDHVTMQGRTSITAGKIVLTDLISEADPKTGQAPSVVYAYNSLRLIDSNVSTIKSETHPYLLRSSCSKSIRADYLGGTWGVCTDD
jgi:hypothetical protein